MNESRYTADRSAHVAAGRMLRLVGLVCFEAGAIVILHKLGTLDWMTVPWGSWQTWLDIAPAEDVVAAGLRTVALGIAYWVAVTTAFYALAKASRIPQLIRATAWATLPPIRCVIDRSIAVTVTTAAMLSPVTPALAGDAPPTTEPIIYQINDQGVPTPVNPPTIEPTLIGPPGSVGAGYTPVPAGGVESATDLPTNSRTTQTVHEVVEGDNLWTISAAHLRTLDADRAIDTPEIAIYWRRVIELNAPTLRSGDPNLIYPGEQIVLPAPDHGGES